jgi:ketosteroid isomerase-like protein
MAEIAEGAREELAQLGQRWAQAERDGDAAALTGLLADDFTGVGPLGFLLTRDAWIGRYQPGHLVNREFSWKPVSARAYGTTAVVVGIQTQDSTYRGRPAGNGRFRVTQVLDRSSGTWRLAGIHIGALADEAA